MPPPDDSVVSLLDQVAADPTPPPPASPSTDPVLSLLDQVSTTPSPQSLDAITPHLWRRILQEKGAYQGAQARGLALARGPGDVHESGGPEPEAPPSQFPTAPLWDIQSEDQLRDVLYRQHGYPSTMPERGYVGSAASGFTGALDQLWTELRNVSGNADLNRQPGDIALEQQRDAERYAPPTLGEEVASGVGASLPTVAGVAVSRGRTLGPLLRAGSKWAVPAEVGATTAAQNISDPNQTPSEALVNAALETLGTRAGGAFEPGFHVPVAHLPAEISKEMVEEGLTNAAQDVASQNLGKDSDKPYDAQSTLHQLVVGALAGGVMAGGMAIPAEGAEAIRHQLSEAQLRRALAAVDPNAATRTDLTPVETPDPGAALPVDPTIAAALAQRGVPPEEIARLGARGAAVEARQAPTTDPTAALHGSDGDIVALANQIRAEHGLAEVDDATSPALPPIDTEAADTAVAAEPTAAANLFDSEDQQGAPIADWFDKLAAEDAMPAAGDRQTSGRQVPDTQTRGTQLLDTLKEYHDFVASLSPEDRAKVADALQEIGSGKHDPSGAIGNLKQVLLMRNQLAARAAASPKENGHAETVRSDQAHPDVPRNPGEGGQDQGGPGVQRQAPAGREAGDALREVNPTLQRGGFLTPQQAAARANAPVVDRNAETRRMTPLGDHHALPQPVPGQVVPPSSVAPPAHPAAEPARAPEVASPGQAGQSAAAPAPAPAKRRARVPEPAHGPDILNHIDQVGGITSRPRGYQGGEYDDQPPLRGIYSRIMSRTGGLLPDQAAKALHDQGIGDGTTNTMWKEVGRAIEQRSQKPLIAESAAHSAPAPVEPDARSPDEIAKAEADAGYEAPFRVGAGERPQAVPRAAIERLVGRYGTVTMVPGGIQITGRGGARILVRTAERVANRGAVGQFTVESQDGTPIGMIDLVRGKAQLRTLSHELVHAFKAMRLITSKEWGALVRTVATPERLAEIRRRYADHGVELSQAQAQEEAVAEYIEQRDLTPAGWGSRILQWVRRIAAAMGLVHPSGHDVAAAVAAGKPLERSPGAPEHGEPRNALMPADRDLAVRNQQSIFDAIDTSHDVPLGGGTSKDGKRIYIDPRIPQYLTMKDGTVVDVHRAIAIHEAAEKPAMDAGKGYAAAHTQNANPAENEYLRSLGVDPAEYNAALKPYLQEIERSGKNDNLPHDLEPKPYVDSGMADVLKPAPKGDFREDINRGMAKREVGQQGLFDEEAKGTTGQQLLFSIPPDKRQTAFQTVQSPTGSHDFGDITPDIAKAGQVPAAPIRLLRGHDTGQGNGFGLEHIQNRRAALLKRLGVTAQQFIQSVVGDMRSARITAPGGNVLEVTRGDRKVVLGYFPRPTPYYSVLTAVDQPAHLQAKGRVVWDGREAPSPGTQQTSPPPKPFAAGNAEDSGRTPVGDQTSTDHPPGEQPGKDEGVDSTPRFSIPAGPVWRFRSADIVAEDPKFPAKAPGDSVLSYLRNRGVNDRELYWTGLDKIAGQKVVTKDQVAALLAQPKVQLAEKVRGGGDTSPEARQQREDAEFEQTAAGARLMRVLEQHNVPQVRRANIRNGLLTGEIKPEDLHPESVQPARDYLAATEAFRAAHRRVAGSTGPARYGEYTLPGGNNYRELLVTLPPTRALPDGYQVVRNQSEVSERAGSQWIVNGPGAANGVSNRYASGRTREEAIAKFHENHSPDLVYRSGHWEEPNVLVHARFNERSSVDGRRVLHIEEIQSDWHQAGRENGYRSEAMKRRDEAEANPLPGGQIPFIDVANAPPDAPFAKSWEEIGFKRMLRYAAENGFDRVTWTTGEQQAERYNLAKQVSRLVLEVSQDGRKDLRIDDHRGHPIVDERGVTDQRIVDLIGKDAASRLESVRPTIKHDSVDAPRMRHILSGDGLKVGGEGMKAAYDQRLVGIAKDIGKKYGVHPGTDELSEGGPVRMDVSADPNEKDTLPISVHSLDITPAMREDALKGQQLRFSIPLPGSEDWQSSDKEVEERFQRAHGIEKDSLIRRVKEWGGNVVKQFQRHFEHLDPKQDAQAIQILRSFESGMGAAPTIAWKRMLGWVRGMSPKDMKIFERALILPDLVKDIQEGLYDDRPGSVPFYGKGDEDARPIDQVRSAIEADAARVEKLLTPELRQRLVDRQAFQRAFAQELVDAGLMRPEILEDERYYHRQVMKYANAPKLPGLRGSDVRNSTRGAQRKRAGGGDFNTMYVESEFEYLSQMMQELAKVETLAKLKGEFDIKDQLRSEAKARNQQGMEEWHQAQLDAMGGGHDLEGKPWDQEFRARIASNMQELEKIAKTGAWPKGPFDDFIERLAAGQATTDDPDWFPFLAWAAEGGRVVGMPGDGGTGRRAQPYTARPEIHARAIFRAIGDREAMVKATLGKKYHTWQQVAAEHGEDYTIWQPEEGQQIVPGWSVADHAITQALQAAGVPVDEVAEAALPEVVPVPGKHLKRSLLVMGPKPQWVIPSHLAQQLQSMRNAAEMPAWIRGSEWLTRQWKRIVLLNPARVVKYSLNNVVGDVDIAMTHPGIFKEVPAAARELWGWVHDKAQPPEVAARLEQASKAGIIDSSLSVAELPDISRQDAVRLMSHGDEALWKRVLVGAGQVAIGQHPLVHKLQVWRESILRLAAARFFYRQIASGKKPLGASSRDEVAQLYAARDAKTGAASKAITAELAAKLSRDLIGDYGGLSVAGQHLRRTLIPFYSWMEINAPRYWRLIQNARYEGGPAAGARAAAGIALVNTGKLAIAAGALTAAVYLWNAGMKSLLGVRDDEDPNKDLAKQFIVLGRRGDGTLITVKTNGALADALDWFGLGNAKDKGQRLVKAYEEGKLLDQARQTAADVAVAPVNKLAAGITPVIKSPAESLMGKTIYPDIRSPKPIRDQADYWAGTFGLSPAYRALTDRADPVSATTGTLLTEINPGQSSYYAAKSMVRDYLASQGKESPGGEPTTRSNYLAEARSALARGENDRAQRWLAQYYDAGGTPKTLRQSLISGAPQHGLRSEEQLAAFRASLSQEDQRQYDAGVDYYNTHLGRSGDLLRLGVEVWGKKHPGAAP